MGLNPEKVLDNLKEGKPPYEHRVVVEECWRQLKMMTRSFIPQIVGTSQSSTTTQGRETATEKEAGNRREKNQKGLAEKEQLLKDQEKALIMVKKEKTKDEGESDEGKLEVEGVDYSPDDARQPLEEPRGEKRGIQEPPPLRKDEIPRSLSEFKEFVLEPGSYQRLVEANVSPYELKRKLTVEDDRKRALRIQEEVEKTKEWAAFQEAKETLKAKNVQRLRSIQTKREEEKREKERAGHSEGAKGKGKRTEETTRKRVFERKSPKGPDPPWKKENKSDPPWKRKDQKDQEHQRKSRKDDEEHQKEKETPKKRKRSISPIIPRAPKKESPKTLKKERQCGKDCSKEIGSSSSKSSGKCRKPCELDRGHEGECIRGPCEHVETIRKVQESKRTTNPRRRSKTVDYKWMPKGPKRDKEEKRVSRDSHEKPRPKTMRKESKVQSDSTDEGTKRRRPRKILSESTEEYVRKRGNRKPERDGINDRNEKNRRDAKKEEETERKEKKEEKKTREERDEEEIPRKEIKLEEREGHKKKDEEHSGKRIVLVERRELRRPEPTRENNESRKEGRCERECNKMLKEEDNKRIFCTDQCWKNRGHTGKCACPKCCTHEEWKKGLIERGGSKYETTETRYVEDILEEEDQLRILRREKKLRGEQQRRERRKNEPKVKIMMMRIGSSEDDRPGTPEEQIIVNTPEIEEEERLDKERRDELESIYKELVDKENKLLVMMRESPTEGRDKLVLALEMLRLKREESEI